MSILNRFSRSSILTTVLSILFLVFVGIYSAFSDGSNDPSTRRLWADFRDAVDAERERDAYFAMVKLCSRDAAFSQKEKAARWSACNSTAADICRATGDCKRNHDSPHPPCTSGAAIDDDSLFTLWMNCQVISRSDEDSVRILVKPSLGEVDYRGGAVEVKR